MPRYDQRRGHVRADVRADGAIPAWAYFGVAGLGLALLLVFSWIRGWSCKLLLPSMYSFGIS